MALRNLLSLLTMATMALILSANTESVNALSIEAHGHHVSRHVLHESIAKKRRASSQRCKPRPTSTAGNTQAPTTTAKATSTSSSKAASTSTSTKASSGSGGSGSGSSNSGSSGNGNSGSSGGDSGSADTGGLARGLAWAVDNTFAPTIAPQGSAISWIWHWADGPVSTVPYLEFVPCFWGPSNQDKWNQRVAEMKQNQPQHLLGFNEPDIDSQSNMSPGYAADVWMEQIHQWGQKGVKLGSPQIAYDQDWMASFLSNIEGRGGWVDFIVLHWYGSFKDIDSFKSYVTSAHQKFNKPIWVTEVGVTTASGASEADCLNFMKEVLSFLASTGYVQRASWFGSFTQSNAPDGFATGNNALFYSKSSLTSLGKFYSS